MCPGEVGSKVEFEGLGDGGLRELGSFVLVFVSMRWDVTSRNNYQTDSQRLPSR